MKYLPLLLLLACASPVFSPGSAAPVTKPSPVATLYWDDFWACSAVVTGEHMVFTAAHCVPEALSHVSLQVGELRVDSSRITRHPSLDIAVVYFDASLPGPYAELGAVPLPADLGYVEGYGCPDDEYEPIHATRWITFVTHHQSLGMVFLGTACHGDSGGGLFDQDGLLIGITYSRGQGGGQSFVFGVDVLEALMLL